MDSHPIGKIDDTPLFPAIAIPVETKLEFECPPDHVDCLCKHLGRITKVLTVGWAAQEQHFLKLLREHLTQEIRVEAVAGPEPQGEQVLDRIKGAGIRLVAERPVAGFTEYVVSPEAERFFQICDGSTFKGGRSALLRFPYLLLRVVDHRPASNQTLRTSGWVKSRDPLPGYICGPALCRPARGQHPFRRPARLIRGFCARARREPEARNSTATSRARQFARVIERSLLCRPVRQSILVSVGLLDLLRQRARILIS